MLANTKLFDEIPSISFGRAQAPQDTAHSFLSMKSGSSERCGPLPRILIFMDATTGLGRRAVWLRWRDLGLDGGQMTWCDRCVPAESSAVVKRNPP